MRIALLGDFDTFLFRGLERPPSHGQYRLSPALNLARGFAELGVKDIHYFVNTPEVDKETVDDGPFGALHRLPCPPLSGTATFYLWRRHIFLKALRRIQPDIVHGQGTEEQYALAAVTSPYPHVITFHGIIHRVHEIVPPPLISPNHVPRFVEKFVVKKAKNVICLSHEVENFLRERNSQARCYFIPNAVAPCFFETQPAPRNENEFTLLFVGTIYPLKGLLHIVEAMPLVQKSAQKTVKLHLIGAVGGGKIAADYEKLIRNRAAELQIHGQIEWLGVQNERGVAQALTQADVLVSASFQETSPMAVAEAMAAGVPVVATRAGGTSELVDDGVTGLLVAAANAEELAAALAKLCRDSELRRQMGAAARAKALAKYAPSVVAQQTLAVYESICRETRGGVGA
jgi:glycosyltransferase involved in cell wall biosynthesis